MRFPTLSEIKQLPSVWGQMIQQYERDFFALKPATGQVTLTASATSTTLSHAKLRPTSVVMFCPKTASAITAFAGMRTATPTQGAVVITHLSNAATDQTFDYLISGV
jgi:hypothetical protein